MGNRAAEEREPEIVAMRSSNRHRPSRPGSPLAILALALLVIASMGAANYGDLAGDGAAASADYECLPSDPGAYLVPLYNDNGEAIDTAWMCPGVVRVGGSVQHQAGLAIDGLGRFGVAVNDVAAGELMVAVSAVETPQAGTGTVTGTVRDWNGDPIDDIYVSVRREDAITHPVYVASAVTDENGFYSITDVPAGDGYLLLLRDWTGARRVATEWYADAASTASATTFSLADGQARVFDVSLDPAASVTGTVRDSGGAPIEGMYVSAEFADEGCCRFYAYTNAAGEFSLHSLPEAEFFIRIGGGTSPLYPDEWFDDVPGEELFCGGSPDTVVVHRGGTLADIDVVLEARSRPGPVTPAEGPPPEDWLGVVNWYRNWSAVAPVVDEIPCWSAGIAAHLTYLELTPSELKWPNAHTENPESPYYTPEGAAAGGSSNLSFRSDSERDAIENWMVAPFHAIGVLRPNLWWSAFARSDAGYAGLDVLRGMVAAPSYDEPILFPGDGATVPLTRFWGESPSPLETCVDFTMGSLPLIAMLPATPSPDTAAAITLPSGETLTSESGDVCIVSEHTYYSSNPVYSDAGLSVLQQSRAVFLIIEQELKKGAYSVSLGGNGPEPIDWSFGVVEAPSHAVNLTGTRAENGHAILEWEPPIEDGGSQVVSYRIDVREASYEVDADTTRFEYVDPDPTEYLWANVTAQSVWYPIGGTNKTVGVQVPPMTWIPNGLFIDDNGSLFEADIEWLATADVTRGCNPPANDRFCPDEYVTRGQMAAFLARALDLENQLDDPFVDDDASIFEGDIERLAAAGITRGCNPPANDSFCPNASVTRAQMAAFLVRALGYTDDGDGDLFADDNGSIFQTDINRLGTAGVTRGCNPPSNDRFCPDDYVTRGQMAAFLRRALG